MTNKLFLIVFSFAIILLLQDFAEASVVNEESDINGELTSSNKNHHHHHHHLPPPRKINCTTACANRCMKASRKKMCHRACKTCCFRCNCVPPGTYGNLSACPCYASLKTHGNRPKCP